MALTERDKRMLMILGVVAALAVVYLFLFVLRGGEGGEVVEPRPTETGTPTVGPTPTETPRTTSPPVVPIADRDPFSIPPGLSPSPTGGGVSPTGTASPTVSPTVSPTTSPTTSPTVSPTVSPTPPPPTDQVIIGGHDVRILDVFAKRTRVQVEVDGRVWTVEEGAIFAESFKLVKILDGRCARFLFGDQSFELCAQARK